MTVELSQRDAAIEISVGVIGSERDRPLITFQRFRGAADRSQRNAAIVVGVGHAGIDRDRFRQ